MTPQTLSLDDTTAGTFTIGDRPVRRLGFGAMRITGPGIWGPPEDIEESIGAIAELRDEGKVANVGVSNVTVEELRMAHAVVPIVTVQNRYNIVERKDEDVLDVCSADGLGFIPWLPINKDKVEKNDA